MENIGPDGDRLVGGRPPRDADKVEAEAAASWKRANPYHSRTEYEEFLHAQRAKATQNSVPYYDVTMSAVKSVSVLQASYRVDAMQARERGETDRADALDGRADAIDRALLDAAADAVQWLESHAAYTRTGHHSKVTGQWRDAAGLTVAAFLHHLSRDGDPQLHVHAAVWNRVQRADGGTASGGPCSAVRCSPSWGWRRSLTGSWRAGCAGWGT